MTEKKKPEVFDEHVKPDSGPYEGVKPDTSKGGKIYEASTPDHKLIVKIWYEIKKAIRSILN